MALITTLRRNLRRWKNVTVIRGDGLTPETLPPMNKVLLACALGEVPKRFLDALPEGGRLVAPLLTGDDNQQILTLLTRTDGQLHVSQRGPVRYVAATEAKQAGFDEVNMNVGCPSPRVQAGRFGACLMLEPARVAVEGDRLAVGS